jgi:hypothetical protein
VRACTIIDIGAGDRQARADGDNDTEDYSWDELVVEDNGDDAMFDWDEPVVEDDSNDAMSDLE